MIADSFSWRGGGFRRFAEPRTGRSETPKSPAARENPEVVPAEADHVVAVFEFGQPDEFAGHRLADEHEFPSPFDLAVRPSSSNLVVRVVPGIVQLLRQRPRRGRIDVGWRNLPQRLMRTIFVVVAAETIETRLLLLRIER